MPDPENTNNTNIQTPSTTTTAKTTPDTPHPIMEFAIDEFLTLPSKKNNKTRTLKPEDFSDNLMDQSPAEIANRPLQTKFKRPHKNTSASEDHFILTSQTRDQRNSGIHVCREIHKYSFRDIDKMQNINTDKKRRIMYIELGDYDPSNEYVANYSDTKTIRL